MSDEIERGDLVMYVNREHYLIPFGTIGVVTSLIKRRGAAIILIADGMTFRASVRNLELVSKGRPVKKRRTKQWMVAAALAVLTVGCSSERFVGSAPSPEYCARHSHEVECMSGPTVVKRGERR